VNIGFLSTHSNFRTTLGTIALLVILLLAYLIWDGYGEAIRVAETKTRDYASVLEARLDATLRRTDSDLEELALSIPLSALNQKATGRLINEVLKAHLTKFPELESLRIFDANGDVIYYSDDTPVAQTNISDRSHFRQVRDNINAGLVFSKVVVSRITGRPSIFAVSGLRDARGNFHGVIIAAISLTYFQNLFRTLDIGQSGNVAIYRKDDFSLVQRWPPGEGIFNAELPSNSPTRSALASGNKFATVEIASATDGITRIYSYAVLDRYPFFVSVGVARDDALAGWRNHSMWVALSGLLLITALFGLLYRLWRAEYARASLAAIVNSSNDAIIGRAIDGTITSWNTSAERMFGYTYAEAMGQDAAIFIPHDSKDEVLRNEALLEDDFAIEHTETVRLTKRGERIDVSLARSPIKSDTGELLGVSLIFRDLTEQKQARESLRKSRAQLTLFIEHSPTSVAMLDQGMNYLAVSRHWQEAYGRGYEDLIGRNHYEVLPDIPDAWKRINQECLAGATLKSDDDMWIDSDGIKHWLRWAVQPWIGENGEIGGIIISNEDITARKQAEVKLRQFKAIINASDDAIISKTLHGIITSWNPGAERLFGYKDEEVMGESMLLIIPSDRLHEEPEILARLSRGERVEHFETVRRHKDGKLIHISATISPILNADGKVIGASKIARNITERKLAENARIALETQLRESQKMESIGTLAGGIAHDFNNIVATILGNTEIACQDAANNPLVLDSLHEIRKAGRRAREVVQQILSFSRRQPTERKLTALAPLIDESVRMLRTLIPARVSLDVQVDLDAPSVLADATQIQQIVFNLATNAMQSMNDQPGRIQIRLDSVFLDATLIAANPQLRPFYDRHPGNTVRIEVTDNGPGMNAATLERIFDPFFTTKPPGEGTGLGLSVVHGIVQTHEGAIVVTSELGTGTTFTLYLPAAAEQVEVPASDSVASTSSQHSIDNLHILYLDDDEALVSLVTRLLERRNYRVSGFTSQVEALAALRADPASFDLVVTDYNMPGMSGLDIAREVRSICASLPVAIASGYIDDNLQAEAEGVGVRKLIFKASAVEDLANVIGALALEARVTNNSTI
jgi:PAS domain S-box-containing protein